ncbi:hypothetical protein [Nonomuraea sp. NPDC003754]
MQDRKAVPPFINLGEGLQPKDLMDAIRKSGYPFQAEIADIIRQKVDSKGFAIVQEEWPYLDKDSDQIRSLDIYAEFHVSNEPQAASGLRSFRASLLVECKQSALPYIFFLRLQSSQFRLQYPEIVGLEPRIKVIMPPERYGLSKNGSPLTFSSRLSDIFELHEFPIFDPPTPYAISISKAQRAGSRLDLSGEEVYRSLTLPLIKAVDYFRSQSAKDRGARSIPHFVMPIVVIRAPMFGVILREGQQQLIGVPWVRGIRTEPFQEEESRASASTVRCFDVVHESFIETYLTLLKKNLHAAANRMLSLQPVLTDGIAVSPAGDKVASYKGLVPASDELKQSLSIESQFSINVNPPAKEIIIRDVHPESASIGVPVVSYGPEIYAP